MAARRLEAYNAFKHTWGGGTNLFTGAIVNVPSRLGGSAGHYAFGALNAIRPSSQCILHIAAKVYF